MTIFISGKEEPVIAVTEIISKYFTEVRTTKTWTGIFVTVVQTMNGTMIDWASTRTESEARKLHDATVNKEQGLRVAHD